MRLMTYREINASPKMEPTSVSFVAFLSWHLLLSPHGYIDARNHHHHSWPLGPLEEAEFEPLNFACFALEGGRCRKWWQP